MQNRKRSLSPQASASTPKQGKSSYSSYPSTSHTTDLDPDRTPTAPGLNSTSSEYLYPPSTPSRASAASSHVSASSKGVAISPADFFQTDPPVCVHYNEDPATLRLCAPAVVELARDIADTHRNPGTYIPSEFWVETMIDPPEGPKETATPTEKNIHKELQAICRNVTYKLSVCADEANWLDEYKSIWKMVLEEDMTKDLTDVMISYENEATLPTNNPVKYGEIGFKLDDITTRQIRREFRQDIARLNGKTSATNRKNDLAINLVPNFSEGLLLDAAEALQRNFTSLGRHVMNPFSRIDSTSILVLTMEGKSDTRNAGSPLPQSMALAVVMNRLWRSTLWKLNPATAFDTRLPEWPVIMMNGTRWELYVAKDMSGVDHEPHKKKAGHIVSAPPANHTNGKGDSVIHLIRIGDLGSMYSVQSLYMLLASIKTTFKYCCTHIWPFQANIVYNLANPDRSEE